MSRMIRIAGIVKESAVDGPGIRFTVFTQGCRHNCPGCHNPQTHDFEGGSDIGIDSLIEQMKKDPLLDGITLSGGEPFEQAAACCVLARRVHDMDLNVMTYSGYTFEKILSGADERPEWLDLLRETDILVDGPFELSRKNILLRFRGSENQRLIDVKRSLAERCAVPADI